MKLTIFVHGVHTSHKEAESWYAELAKRIESQAAFFYYGWTLGASIRLPVVGLLVRRRLTKKLQKFVAKAMTKLPPAIEVDAIGHSFGCWLIHRSMTLEESARCFYRRVVYMGGVVSSRESFEKEWPHFQAILNLHSRGDDVVRLAPFGHSGYRGFANADGQIVRNLDVTPANHKDYTTKQAGWNNIVEFLNADSI